MAIARHRQCARLRLSLCFGLVSASLEAKSHPLRRISDFRSAAHRGAGRDLISRKGPAVTNAWRTRQFEYQWLRALAGRYADFLQVTEESLLFTAKQLQLELSADKREQLMLHGPISNLAYVPAT